jgi:hypothetical protein
MAITLILVLFAAVALAAVIFRMKGRSPDLDHDVDITELLNSVDLEAFRNLIDEEEERFLRANLPPAEFRRVQRQRLRAAIDYIAGVSQNAKILLHLGQISRHSPDHDVAEAGRQLVDSASRLRVYSLIATTKLYGRLLLPKVSGNATQIVGDYEQMKDCAALLARLRNPVSAGMMHRAL